MGFYFDQTRCHGCHTCAVACKDWHDIQDEGVDWIRVSTMEDGKYPDVRVFFLVVPCAHCVEPACAEVCPASAITKRAEDGVVVVDQESCLGIDKCNLCKQACLYDAPQFGAAPNAKMQKCNFCLDRLAEGRKPACVDACPMVALDAGPLDELERRYRSTREVTSFTRSAKAKPCLIFKPKMS
ncbi:MAG TPA: 4Fe-4S dicluster domain-containing protein [Dehalococcoidia bacterium]|nr:4Fe-4S dicluster domain-containing protein [Dehalococcoidia bacterium]